jgi:RNA polymerase sigma-70 factor (ECF subfamily)
MAGASVQGGEPARLREGDPAAWESFYERVYPMMLAFAQRRLGYNEEARDAVSEALARTVTTIARMAELDTTPEAWSFGILRNVVLDLQRRTYRDRQIPVSGLVTAPDPSEALDERSEHENVRRAFAQLNDIERELLELRVVAGLTSEQVAVVLAMSPGAVRMAQARALTKLRNLLPEDAQQ